MFHNGICFYSRMSSIGHLFEIDNNQLQIQSKGDSFELIFNKSQSFSELYTQGNFFYSNHFTLWSILIIKPYDFIALSSLDFFIFKPRNISQKPRQSSSSRKTMGITTAMKMISLRERRCKADIRESVRAITLRAKTTSLIISEMLKERRMIIKMKTMMIMSIQ